MHNSCSGRRKRRVPRWRRRVAHVQWVGAVVIVAALASGAAADEILLKGSVRLAGGTDEVRLADIAELSGPLAQKYANTVVARLHDSTGAMEVSVHQVRSALSDAGVHWGKVNLSGATVIVRPTGPGDASGPLFMTPATIETAARALPAVNRGKLDQADDLVILPTLRGAVARTIVAGLGLPPESVRMTFNDRDAAMLDVSLDTYRFEIQPMSNLDSDRVDLSIRAWSDGRVVNRQSLSVRLLLSTEVVVVRRDIRRGDVMHEADCAVERRWITPIQASTLCGFVEAVGRVANMPLKAGDVLKKKHVKREVLVRRGDRVMVRCLVGGVVLSLAAEARGNGAEGEIIELRKLGERDTFMATIVGPGSAIVDLSR